ncbi:MAG: hypothetical protein EOO45_02775 [Flavobacterium sp.]|nr:MAG: hypothetical protein EOO45_02775 [Flavobacterium sp.]
MIWLNTNTLNNKKFVEEDIKTSYFYVQTGIKASGTLIEKNIELKERLDLEYNWEKVILINRYPALEDGELVIKIRWVQVFFARLLSIATLAIGLGALILCFYCLEYYFAGQIKESLITVGSTLVILVASVRRSSLSSSGIQACLLKKKDLPIC